MTKTDIVIGFRSTDLFRTERCLEACVNSVIKYTRNFRFIFVDDNSDSYGRGYISNIADNFRDCILIRTNFQHWYSRAYNLGLNMVRTPYTVMLNSDIVVHEGWLETLYSNLEEANQELLNGDIVATFAGEQLHKIGLIGSENNLPDEVTWILANNNEYVCGHCVLVSMEAMNEIKAKRHTYLDESEVKTIHVHSDVELCFAMKRLGWGVVKCWNVNIDHVPGQSWGHQLHTIPKDLAEVNYKYECGGC